MKKKAGASSVVYKVRERQRIMEPSALVRLLSMGRVISSSGKPDWVDIAISLLT